MSEIPKTTSSARHVSLLSAEELKKYYLISSDRIPGKRHI
jgi:hypothetical protein